MHDAQFQRALTLLDQAPDVRSLLAAASRPRRLTVREHRVGPATFATRGAARRLTRYECAGVKVSLEK